MAKKDKFQQLKEGGGMSFDDLARQATTFAAIERQAVSTPTPQPGENTHQPAAVSMQLHEYPSDVPRMTHLPNPWISAREYNLASQYCYQHTNMTRQDFVELAIIEKLHNEGLIPDEEFAKRRDEIRNRPPRGMRKNTKKQMNK